jgi:tartrate dehydrogenase/decarboxylase/D-malate dehydrogenase
MFEPVHGSALDIAGRRIASPIGQSWSASMVLEHLGEKEAATDIVTAIERVMAEPSLRTWDHGGRTNT